MPRLSEFGEDELIRRIERRFRGIGPVPRAAIGEDAAIVRLPGAASDLALSTDILIEGTHFRRREVPPDLLGWKVLAANLSDMAAVGARPHSCLLGLGLPPGMRESDFEAFLRGLRRLCRRYRVRLLGGDTCRSSRLMIGVTIVGTLPAGRSLSRTGARPGDFLFVSGPLGAAAMGLRMLRNGWRLRGGRPRPPRRGGDRRRPAAAIGAALRAHFQPDPPVEAGRVLAARGLASAAIDLSDGLSIDLDRMCAASRVGATVDLAAVPVADCVRRLVPADRAASIALAGGEDYELLIAAPPRQADRLARLRAGGRRFIRIGEIRPRRNGLKLREPSGRLRRLRPSGYRHFSD